MDSSGTRQHRVFSALTVSFSREQGLERPPHLCRGRLAEPLHDRAGIDRASTAHNRQSVGHRPSVA